VCDLALVDFDQAMRLGFSDARAYNKRGLVWHEKGRYERAIADFTRAIKTDPTLAAAYINRGRLCMTRLICRLRSRPGARNSHRRHPVTALLIEGQFLPRPEGVQLISSMTIAFAGWLRRTGLNPWLIEWRFPAERRNAWLKHRVEEIDNLQFFLPDLYRRSQPG
jgi:tetratricopeptide (TPR) repeat protein